MTRRTKVAEIGPHPVDVHVGERLNLRRKLLGVSQDYLARKVKVSFQQIQKYERGDNRVSASRLHQIADVLGVPVAFFFDGYLAAEDRAETIAPPRDDDPLYSTEALRVLAALQRLSAEQRDRLLALAESINR